MPDKYININFPFKDSDEGFYLDLNSTTKEAVRADLLHLLLTNKGERLYMPDFGTDLRKYLFEPNDKTTEDDIISEINQTVKLYLPIVDITSIQRVEVENQKAIKVVVTYKIKEGVFETTDTVEVTF
jgi:phage baseplate assembly protein W